MQSIKGGLNIFSLWGEHYAVVCVQQKARARAELPDFGDHVGYDEQEESGTEGVFLDNSSIQPNLWGCAQAVEDGDGDGVRA